jgi:hypothetical protein
MFGLSTILLYGTALWYYKITSMTDYTSKAAAPCNSCLMEIQADTDAMNANSSYAIPIALSGVALLIVSTKWKRLKSYLYP